MALEAQASLLLTRLLKHCFLPCHVPTIIMEAKGKSALYILKQNFIFREIGRYNASAQDLRLLKPWLVMGSCEIEQIMLYIPAF